jgi:hypothetical protein
MCNALIQLDVLINNNNELCKLKISLKNKVFRWYPWKEVILTKDNLAKWNWHGSKKSVFCHQDETIKHLVFQCCFARSIWSVIQFASLYLPCSVANIFGNWLHGIDHRFRMHISVGAIAIIFCYVYAEIIKRLMIKKTLICCRFFTDVPIFSVYGHLYSMWRIKTYLWRSI